jgi:hypothetical protein
MNAEFNLPDDGTVGVITIKSDGAVVYVLGMISPSGPSVLCVAGKKLAYNVESTAANAAMLINQINRLGGLESVSFDTLFASKAPVPKVVEPKKKKSDVKSTPK